MSTMRRRIYPSARARMGASVIAWMLPGSCSMLLPDARPTSITSTRGSARSCSCASPAITALRFCSGMYPERNATATIMTTTRKIDQMVMAEGRQSFPGSPVSASPWPAPFNSSSCRLSSWFSRCNLSCFAAGGLDGRVRQFHRV